MVLEHSLNVELRGEEAGLQNDGGSPGRFKLALVLASVVLLAACQSSAPISQVPVEEPSGQPRGEGQQPGGYPGPSRPDAPGQYEPQTPRPEPARPVEPPNIDAAIDAIEADAESYMAQQQWKKSIETAEHGLRLDRRNAGFYRILGESYRQLGDIPQAQRFARQAQRYCRGDCGSTDQLIRSLNMK